METIESKSQSLITRRLASINDALADADITARPDEVIIRDLSEFLLIREFRALRLKRQHDEAKNALSELKTDNQK